MYKVQIVLFFFSLFSGALNAQESDEPMYNVNRWVSGSIGVGGTITNILGIQSLLDKDSIPLDVVLALDKNDVNSFDRYALNQNLDKVDRAKTLSDIGLYASFFAPGFLFFDDKIRKEWKDISLMYFESQAIAANIYAWGPFGPRLIDRYRPGAYYVEFSLEERRLGRKRNSFFSGHVSTTATASFFMAQVYCDFHHELGKKKILIYALALIPPAFVGHNRIRSLNHFPTDVIMGTFVGAAVGILIPVLHKNKKRDITVSSLSNGYGLALQYKF